MIYAFNENFVLPLSHDEVVYGKGSLIGKMPGDDWQKFANLRALFGYMWGHPGKKLLFMGGEFGQRREWTHDGELEWWVSALPEHAGVQRWVRDLNRVYRSEPALHRIDFSARTASNGSTSTMPTASVIAFLRKAPASSAPVLVVCNFTPVPRSNYLRRRAATRHLARDPEQRRARIRRRRLGQSRRRRIGAGGHARPRRIGESQRCRRWRPSCCAGKPHG